VVKWISQRSSEPLLQVRVLPGAQRASSTGSRTGRVRSPVEHSFRAEREKLSNGGTETVRFESCREHSDRVSLEVSYMYMYV